MEPLTESGVQQTIRDLAEKAEIGRRVWPHLFRHSFITYQYSRVPTLHLKEIIGHSSTAMIDRVYSHIKPADAYDALARSMQASRS